MRLRPELGRKRIFGVFRAQERVWRLQMLCPLEKLTVLPKYLGLI